jgi:putative membrane protein
MKWRALGALACAAMVTVACGGDARYDRDNDADRTVGTSGVSNDDSAAVDRDDDARASRSARIGAAVDEDQTKSPGSADTHGATGEARHFAEQATYAGNAEVKLGQLATERAQTPAVKEFAQMMVRDHTKAGNELKQAVTRHDVQPPAGLDAEHQRLYDRLNKLQGAEFDREYMKAMVDGHQKVKSMLSSRASNQRTGADRNRGATGTSGTTTGSTQLDTAVNQWATKTLPAVEQHLQKAQEISAKVDNARGTTGTTPKGNIAPSDADKAGHTGERH